MKIIERDNGLPVYVKTLRECIYNYGGNNVSERLRIQTVATLNKYIIVTLGLLPL